MKILVVFKQANAWDKKERFQIHHLDYGLILDDFILHFFLNLWSVKIYEIQEAYIYMYKFSRHSPLGQCYSGRFDYQKE